METCVDTNRFCFRKKWLNEIIFEFCTFFFIFVFLLVERNCLRVSYFPFHFHLFCWLDEIIFKFCTLFFNLFFFVGWSKSSSTFDFFFSFGGNLRFFLYGAEFCLKIFMKSIHPIECQLIFLMDDKLSLKVVKETEHILIDFLKVLSQVKK